MDWPSDSDPFIAPNNYGFFDFDFPARNAGQLCKVIKNWGQNGTENIVLEDLRDLNDWERLSQVAKSFIIYQDLTTVDNIYQLPRNSFTILCIPWAESSGSEPPNYTDLPIHPSCKIHWENIVRVFNLPSHFPKLAMKGDSSATSIIREHDFGAGLENIWMHTANIISELDRSVSDMAKVPSESNSFAMAATHLGQKSLTFAVMFGFSDGQVLNMQDHLSTSSDAIGHPLLMLGIYAELQLERLNFMVNTSHDIYKDLVDQLKLQVTGEAKRTLNWSMVDTVRLFREIEAEVKTAQLILSKVYSSAEEQCSTDMTKDIIRKTNLFSDRFNDICTSLDGLGARCRTMVDGLSFSMDIITSELSRQEAKTASALSFVAMIYLPLSAIATIFAMPIFQWSNDWRDLLYRPVHSGNTPSDSNLESSSNTTKSPVVSGYLYIYIGISALFTSATLIGFNFYMRRRIRMNCRGQIR
ncbi:hypothetical protein F4810DRAFT_95775 [Camillea tinctor]|nr:hypothetical protein F4810DRAFT_95775 [Camillea tinctor]